MLDCLHFSRSRWLVSSTLAFGRTTVLLPGGSTGSARESSRPPAVYSAKIDAINADTCANSFNTWKGTNILKCCED